MNIRLDLITVLLLLGMLQAAYQVGILGISGSKSKANRWLILLLIFSFFILLGYFSYLSNLFYSFPYLVGVSGPLTLGLGPCIFLYANALTKRKQFRLVSLLQFIPLLLVLALNYQWLITPMKSKIKLIKYYYSGEMIFSWSTFIYLSILLIHLGVYLFFTYRHVLLMNKRIKENESDASLLKLQFLKKVLFAFLCYLVVFILVYLSWSIQSSYTTQIEACLQLVLSLFVLILGYFVIRNPQLFLEQMVAVEKFRIPKYKNSTLTKEQSQELGLHLQQKMLDEQYYLNSKLSLSELAAEMSLTSHQLSQLLNQELQMNFFDFVNQYRVEETKRKLIDPEYSHLSILGIAFECGFNSKGAFNRIFKKYEGISPSAFIKNYRS